MGSNNQTLKVLDFFCSIGGVSLGFKQAGIEVLGGIDIDESCKETYERNIEAKFLPEDVSELNFKKVGRFFGVRRRQRNLVFVGCSPCQYYSNIKTDKTKSCKTRLLLADFQEFVEYFRPGYVFIENVPGLDSKPESPLGRFKSFLSENGYVFDDDVLNAKYFGVPQNRRRYVLIASRIKKKIKLPEPNRDAVKTVWHAIGNYAKFPPIEHAKLAPINIKRIRKTPHDGGRRSSWENTELQLECYKRHSGHSDVYGRMAWKEPSPAITTRFISYSSGCYGHPEQDRAISLREGATLQTFPENFVFYSESQGTIARMIGNAVPPKLAEAIGVVFTQKSTK